MEKKRKSMYWLFKILSIIISCALPIWAICEKYPIWTTTYGTVHSMGLRRQGLGEDWFDAVEAFEKEVIAKRV